MVGQGHHRALVAYAAPHLLPRPHLPHHHRLVARPRRHALTVRAARRGVPTPQSEPKNPTQVAESTETEKERNDIRLRFA
eukprot:8723672-Pyramimonas_sp.AAC.1